MWKRKREEVKEEAPRVRVTVDHMLDSYTTNEIYSGSRSWKERKITPEQIGTYRVGDTWHFTLILKHDGNGNWLQTPRTIKIILEPVKDEETL